MDLVKFNQDIAITVEDESDVEAFKNYKAEEEGDQPKIKEEKVTE